MCNNLFLFDDIFVTPLDIAELAVFKGISFDDFVSTYCKKSVIDGFPVYALAQPDGHCPFMEKKGGCSYCMDAGKNPVICRDYPSGMDMWFFASKDMLDDYQERYGEIANNFFIYNWVTLILLVKELLDSDQEYADTEMLIYMFYEHFYTGYDLYISEDTKDPEYELSDSITRQFREKLWAFMIQLDL